MIIKAIDYDDLKEGDLITWYGVHVLRWEDEIRPLGIEPTIAFVQDDDNPIDERHDYVNELEAQNAQLREALEKIERIAKDPDNRGEHTQYQMAYFLDDVILPIIADVTGENLQEESEVKRQC